MEKIHEKYGREIWLMVLQAYVDNQPGFTDSTTLTPLSKTDNVFILNKILDQCFHNINRKFHLSLEKDFPAKNERFYFKTLQDIWLYFIERLYDEYDKKIENSSKIIPFNRLK